MSRKDWHQRKARSSVYGERSKRSSSTSKNKRKRRGKRTLKHRGNLYKVNGRAVRQPLCEWDTCMGAGFGGSRSTATTRQPRVVLRSAAASAALPLPLLLRLRLRSWLTACLPAWLLMMVMAMMMKWKEKITVLSSTRTNFTVLA